MTNYGIFILYFLAVYFRSHVASHREIVLANLGKSAIEKKLFENQNSVMPVSNDVNLTGMGIQKFLKFLETFGGFNCLLFAIYYSYITQWYYGILLFIVSVILSAFVFSIQKRSRLLQLLTVSSFAAIPIVNLLLWVFVYSYN